MKHLRKVKEFPFRSFLLVLICFGLILVLKNPYNTSSLIPNLEPYPDSLYYSYPAWHFVQTGNFTMFYDGFNTNIVTPPIYTVFLVPFFSLFKDVRAFFWGNILLYIFFLTVWTVWFKKLMPKYWPPYMLAGLLLVSNFYIFTMPSLMMAELISLAVFMVMIYSLSFPVSAKRITFAVVGTVLLVMIKFSNVFAAGAFAVLYGLKILYMKGNQKDMQHMLKHAFFVSLITGGSALLYILFSGILSDHKNLQEGASFSYQYFSNNIHFYIRSMIGGDSRYLWFTEKFFSPLSAVLAGSGFVIGLFHSKHRLNVVRSLILITAIVCGMSLFVTPDARYITLIYPLLAYGIGLSTLGIIQAFQYRTGTLILVGIMCVYMFMPWASYSQEPHVIALKKQIGLNYLHTEDPWNYLAIEEMNKTVATRNVGKKAYVGTFLPSYYVSYFAKGFTAVPVTFQQEFFSQETGIDLYDSDHLISGYIDAQPKHFDSIEAYYSELLKNGTVYVTNAYQNNRSDVWPAELQKVLDAFEYEVVSDGCLGSCVMYELIIPAKPLANE